MKTWNLNVFLKYTREGERLIIAYLSRTSVLGQKLLMITKCDDDLKHTHQFYVWKQNSNCYLKTIYVDLLLYPQFFFTGMFK